MTEEQLEWMTTFLKTAITRTVEHPSWRLGQAYFNTLHDMRPDLADKIRGTWLDPFYSNGAIPHFLGWLIEAITGDPPEADPAAEPFPGWDA